MAEIVAWSEICVPCQNGSNKGGIRSLKLLDGSIHTVRFVGNPAVYFKYFVNGRSAICADPATCPVRAKYNIEPTVRYAVNILDRDEPDPQERLKILDVSQSALKPIAAWARSHKADPGGKEGRDFSIAASRVGGQMRYMVTDLDHAPFSAEEKAYILGNIYDLLKIYQAVPESEIEARLFGT